MNKLGKISLIIIVNLLFWSCVNNSYASSTGGTILLPSIIEKTVSPGEKVTVRFSLINQDNSELKVIPHPTAGKYDQNHNVEIDNSLEESKWIEYIGDSEEIAFKDKTDIDFVIVVPEKVVSGLYLPMVEFEFKNTDSNKQLGLSYKLIGVVYLNVINQQDGGKRENISIKDFEVKPKFSIKPYTNINLRAINDGNTYTHLVGYIEVFDPQNVRQDNVVSLNPNYSVMFPNEEMNSTFKWEDKTISNKLFPPIGEYKAILHIKGEGNTEFKIEEKKFTVIPIQYGIYLVFVTLILGITIFVIRRKTSTTKN